MTEARLSASLKFFGRLFLLVAFALLLWWARIHAAMNHAGVHLFFGAILVGLVGTILIVLGLAARPDESEPPV